MNETGGRVVIATGAAIMAGGWMAVLGGIATAGGNDMGEAPTGGGTVTGAVVAAAGGDGFCLYTSPTAIIIVSGSSSSRSRPTTGCWT